MLASGCCFLDENDSNRQSLHNYFGDLPQESSGCTQIATLLHKFYIHFKPLIALAGGG